MSRNRKQENIDKDCGGITINLCGISRDMIREMQFAIMRTHKTKPPSAKYDKLIEGILEEKAKEYFSVVEKSL